MRGKEFKDLLYLNEISQDEAANLIGVTRQTINVWCNKSELKGKILTKAKFILEHFNAKNISDFSKSNINGQQIIATYNSGSINADNRQYYSDSQDVLRAQIDLLDARIKEKDAQIKEKDAQISRLMGIIEKMGDK